ncbi:MAG: thioredoxin fold domain-containing protein [Candidatus Competibacteraceae bacterium]
MRLLSQDAQPDRHLQQGRHQDALPDVPREGVGSDSFDKAVSVWCAADRREAMTQAKRGENIERKTCDNPVQAQYELGQKLGVRGTPSMILEDGTMIPGQCAAHCWRNCWRGTRMPNRLSPETSWHSAR